MKCRQKEFSECFFIFLGGGARRSSSRDHLFVDSQLYFNGLLIYFSFLFIFTIYKRRDYSCLSVCLFSDVMIYRDSISTNRANVSEILFRLKHEVIRR
jgi:hypothetical protein